MLNAFIIIKAEKVKQGDPEKPEHFIATNIKAKNMNLMIKKLKSQGKAGTQYRVMALHGDVKIMQETITTVERINGKNKKNKKDSKAG